VILCNYSHRVLHISTGIHDLGPINWELALCLLLAWFCFFLILLQEFKESRLLERYTKIYFHFIICCYQILNFIFVWCHSRQFILLHYSATWRTELADPQALFTFTHPNRGECLKLILLSSRIWTNIWHEFDRNADRQQPLWSSEISYQMRFDASRFRWLFSLTER
jgi:hypothetical protein